MATFIKYLTNRETVGFAKSRNGPSSNHFQL